MKKNNIMKYAIIFGVVIIPLIYSITYLTGFWDPYNNLSDMRVAIVNNDKCSNNCKSDSLINNLKDSDTFKYVVKDADDAEKGLHDKDYYAIITIPSNFTSSFNNVSNIDRSSAVITYRPNSKSNYIATQMLNNAVLKIQKSLQSEISSKVVDGLTKKLESVPLETKNISSGLGRIANGTQILDNGAILLSNGTNSLEKNYGSFDSGIDKLNNGIVSAHNGIDTLNNNSNKIKNGINELNNGVNELKSGSDLLASKYPEFDEGLKNVKEGINALSDNTSKLSEFSNGVSNLKQGSQNLNNGLNNYKTNSDNAYNNMSFVYSTLISYYEANSDLASNKELTNAYMIAKGYMSSDENGMNGIDKLKYATVNLKNGADSLSNGVDNLVNSTASLNELSSGINNLNTGINTLSDKSSEIMSGINNVSSGINKVQFGINNINTNYRLFNNGINKLNSSSVDLVTGGEKLQSSSIKIYDGISTINSSVSSLKNGTNSLNNGLNDAIEMIDSNIDDTTNSLKQLDGLSSYAFEPVKIKKDSYGNVNVYGTFFSPFFISLSLWLGSLMILIGIYYDPDDRFKVLGRNSSNKVKRLIGYVMIGIIQAIVLATVLKLALGFDVTNYLLYYGSCILISLAFLSIMVFLFFNFADVGKFIALILLVLQLAAAGGTFPLEVEPTFFRSISPFLPMTYGIELLRESFVTIEQSLLLKDLSVLFGILIVFGILDIVTDIVLKNKKSVKKSKK